MTSGIEYRAHITGTHWLGPSAAVFAGAVAASFLEIDGGNAAEIVAEDPSRPLMTFGPGSPPIRLRGLVLRGSILVETNSSVELVNCTCYGHDQLNPGLQVESGVVELTGVGLHSFGAGAVRVAGGTVRITSSTLSRNNASHGGAAYQSGGVLVISDSLLEQNAARLAGGAVAVYGGIALLANQTLLQANTAPAGASTFLGDAGTLSYGLPAPIARWIFPVFDCQPFRVACSGESRVPSEQPLHVSQPCHWQTNPAELGLTMRVFDRGSLDDDYPWSCPAGSYGHSLESEDQSSPGCSGTCPSRR